MYSKYENVINSSIKTVKISSEDSLMKFRLESVEDFSTRKKDQIHKEPINIITLEN